MLMTADQRPRLCVLPFSLLAGVSMNGCSTPAFPGVGGVACAWSKEWLAASCSLQPAFCHEGSLAGSDISALRIGESWTIVLSHGEPSPASSLRTPAGWGKGGHAV